MSKPENEFKKVVYKRKGKNGRKCHNRLNIIPDTIADNPFFDLDLNIRRISEAKNELVLTSFFQSTRDKLLKCCASIGEPTITRIICFGLGRISESVISRHQLALLLALRDLLQVEISASDPMFNEHDSELLSHFEVEVVKDNIEGKFEVHSNTVLFYLPHCPKQLTNNLLWRNWGLNLSKCLIIGNSINKIVEDNLLKDLNASVKYINKIYPYVLESALEDNYKFTDVFNDTSIHIFPLDKLRLLPSQFWEDCCEPEYDCDSVEFITNNIRVRLCI